MNPDLEFFLESAFENIKQSLANVGRVVVEPLYDVEYSEIDKQELAAQLNKLLQSQKVDLVAVSTTDGQPLAIPGDLMLLRKYIRSVTLHAEPVEGAWIEVAPPGNWI